MGKTTRGQRNTFKSNVNEMKFRLKETRKAEARLEIIASVI